jgi:hypothetical protein
MGINTPSHLVAMVGKTHPVPDSYRYLLGTPPEASGQEGIIFTFALCNTHPHTSKQPASTFAL